MFSLNGFEKFKKEYRKKSFLIFFFSFFVVLFSFGCSPGPDSKENEIDRLNLSIHQGDDQFASILTQFSIPLTVSLSGSGELANIPVSFSSSGASVQLSSHYVLTNQEGKASITVTAQGSSGIAFVKASLPSAVSQKSVTFKLSINGEAVDWGISKAFVGDLEAGDVFNLNIEALNFDGTVDETFNGPKFLNFSTNNPDSPSGQTAELPSDGIYEFTNGIINEPLEARFFSSSVDPTDTFIIEVDGSGLNTGTTSPVLVDPSSAQGLKILTDDNCQASEILPTSFWGIPTSNFLYAFYEDEWGNCIEGSTASGDWSKTFSDGQAVFNGPNLATQNIRIDTISSGEGQISITDGVFSATTPNFAIQSGAVDHFLISGLNASGQYTVEAGTPFQIRIEARDVFGNLATSYNGPKTLTFTTDATVISSPSALGIAPQSPTDPSGTYNFINGVVDVPRPEMTLFNANEGPRITVFENGDCDTNPCGVSPPIHVTPRSISHALIRSQANNQGGDAATFIPTDQVRTTDHVFNFYCATYDVFGNFLGDHASANWSLGGFIDLSEITPGLSSTATIEYNPTQVGTGGSVSCEVPGPVTGMIDNFTIVPGVPSEFRIDGGAGENSDFSVTAGSFFQTTVNLYDQHGNLTTNYNNPNFSVLVSFMGQTSVSPVPPGELSPDYTTPYINGVAGSFRALDLNFSAGTAQIENLLLVNQASGVDRAQLLLNDAAGVLPSRQSGLIDVATNDVAQILIRTASNNAGSVISNMNMNNDETLTLYAAGYDNSGNYVGDVDVDWTQVPPSGDCDISNLSGNPGALTSASSVIYSPTTSGSCVVTAFDSASSSSFSTGSLASSNGAVDSYSLVLVEGNEVTAGVPFSIRVTALDSDGNRVLNYVPTSYTLETTAGPSPSGQAPQGLNLSDTDFVNGQAVVSGLTVYDAASDFTLTVFDGADCGSSNCGVSDSVSVIPNTLYQFRTLNPAGDFIADGSTAFSIQVQALDQWQNPTTEDIADPIELSAVRLSGEALVDDIAGGDSLSMAGESLQTFSGLTYRVGNEVAIVASNSTGKTTPESLRQSINFSPNAQTIHDYRLTDFSTQNPVAGAPFTAKIVARDILGNTITGLDATLNTFNFQAGSPAATSYFDNAPLHPSGTVVFTDGISQDISFTFYTSETLSKEDLVIDDQLGRVGHAGEGSLNIVSDALALYTNDTTTAMPISADGSTTFEAILRARDQWGNIVTGDASISLGVEQISGGSAGNLGGTTSSINMASGETVINNLTYDVAGQMRLTVSGGSVGLAAVNSQIYNFSAVDETVHRYELSFSSPQTAGETFDVTVTAKDISDNTITTHDTNLNSRTFSWGGITDSPDDIAPDLPASFTFNDGVAVVTLRATRSDLVSAGNLYVQDNLFVSGSSQSDLVIEANSLDHYSVSEVLGPLVASPNHTFGLSIQAHDEFGNLTTEGVGADFNLIVEQVSGANNSDTIQGGDNLSLDAQDSKTFSGLIYRVPHEIDIIVTDTNGVTTPASKRARVEFNPHLDGVDHYTLEAFSTETPTAGAVFNARVVARDVMNNVITGLDSTLSGLGYSFTSPAQNSPFGNAPNYPNGTTLFSSGVSAPLNFTFYREEVINGSDIVVTNTGGRSGNASGSSISVNADALALYKNETTTPMPITASSTQNFEARISARDQWGNIVPGDPSVTIGFNQLTPGTIGTLLGTSSLNMSSGEQIVTDLSYDVAGTIELTLSGGSVSLPSDRSVNYIFESGEQTLSHYQLSFNPAQQVGNAFNITVDAKDVSGNTITNLDAVLNAREFSWSGVESSPEGATPILPDQLDFNNGRAFALVNLKEALTIASGSLILSDDASPSISGASTQDLILAPGSLHHYHVTNASGDFVADGASTFEVTIEARDAFGNLTVDGIGADINLSASHVSGVPNVDSIGGGTDLSLDGSSSRSFSGLTYRVAHEVDLIATDTNLITTPSSLRERVTFSPDIAGLVSYELRNWSSTTADAGQTLTAQLHALDIAGNTMIGLDAELEALNFTFSSNAGVTFTSMGATLPSPGTQSFVDGVASGIEFVFRRAETLAVSDISVEDNNSVTGVSSEAINILPLALDRYHNSTSSPLPINADGLTQFEAQIRALDSLGNIVAGDSSINLGVNHLSGEAAGTLGGTTTFIDMTTGLVTLSNLTYNVAGQMQLTAISGASVAFDTDNSVTYEFEAVSDTVDS